MLLLALVIYVSFCGVIKCDYFCVCIQGSQLNVVGKDNITVIGKASIGDCYRLIQFNDGDNVVAFTYKHQVGHITVKESNISMETCAGTPYDGDALTTPQNKYSVSISKTTLISTTTKVSIQTTDQKTSIPTIGTTISLTTAKQTSFTVKPRSTVTADLSYVGKTTPVQTNDGNTKLCLFLNINHAKQFGGALAQYGHSCYELLPRTKYTWKHGESICHTQGGYLAHITSAAEQAFIQGFMTRHSPQHAVWIGLHDSVNEGHFEWTSGNPVTYTNWVPGHMDNFASHNQEDCVAFIPYQNGTWDDIPCGSKGFFTGDAGETHPLLCQYNTATNAFVG